MIAPLLSRCRVFILKPLGEEDVAKVIARALADPAAGYGKPGRRDRERISAISPTSPSATRAWRSTRSRWRCNRWGSAGAGIALTRGLLEEAAQKRAILYDKKGEEHYNIISALHKSLRGGDPDASLYWLARMLEAGEDPLYVARRLVRFASEDVGNADPQALATVA